MNHNISTIEHSAATQPAIVILGGGVAGLWSLRLLCDRGYDAVLIEIDALGAGQTIASQGIVHAGTKYALTGQALKAAREAARAAAIWKACLPGCADAQPLASLPVEDVSCRLNLSEVEVLSPQTFMFTTPGVGSRLGGLAASKALTIGPKKLDRIEYPGVFADAPSGVDVYRLAEPVVGTRSLLEALAAPVSDRIYHASTIGLCMEHDRISLTLENGESAAVSLCPGALVLAAGSGNEALLDALGLGSEIRQQRRPLHMVYAKSTDASKPLAALFGHCVGMSDKPRATITSHRDSTGCIIWNIGGQIAEQGIEREGEQQIRHAHKELSRLMPWVDFGSVQWASMSIVRAEGHRLDGSRPDGPVVQSQGPVVAAWPTKMVLAPIMASQVCAQIDAMKIKACRANDAPPAWRLPLSGAQIALEPWNRSDLCWSRL